MSAIAKVPPATLARVFWRCLFLQAAWNRRGMQNLGFAYAIDPALRALYPAAAQREEALRRHLGFFNCHPYMAAAIVGGAIHHEEKVAAGAEPGDQPLAYKQTLQGPLAALGDGFFWTALRPFFGALGAVLGLVPWLGLPAILIVLAVYNAVHLTLRITLFRAGHTRALAGGGKRGGGDGPGHDDQRLSNTCTSLIGCPLEFVPLVVMVMTFPSAEIVRVPVMTTFPALFWVNDTVWSSTRLSDSVSALGLPVIGRSLPS